MKKIDKNRLYHGFYLEEWGVKKIDGEYQLGNHPCFLCELSDECDRLADDLNDIEYCICLSEGCIKDIKYKVEHKDAYFKNINNLI